MIIYVPENSTYKGPLCNICAYPIPKNEHFFRDREEKDICMSCHEDMLREEGDTGV